MVGYVNVSYAAIDAAQLDSSMVAAIEGVHRLAFAASIVGREYPAEEVAAALPADAEQPGFCMRIARDRSGRLVGFAFGYMDFPEPPTAGWSKRLADAVGEDHYEWLDRAFGFAWFAVLPSVQKRGVGSVLHDALLADVASARAWLVCPAHETELRAFYDRRGWQLLATDDLGTGTDRAIMGLDLVAARRRARPATMSAHLPRTRA